MTRLTALIIQTNGNDITADSSGPQAGKYAGWITLWRDNRPHISPLVITDFIYDTPKEARAAAQFIIDEIRRPKREGEESEQLDTQG